MPRNVCIHGHFYQPPRENPWTGEVEVDDEAFPYHDWNARVSAECYVPNASSRILDPEGVIVGIVNNYASISMDFGPVLLEWLERNEPGVYAAITSADRESSGKFSGHGAAIAHTYNHLIMPLAYPRDRQTQVIWGIRDFVHRFGRNPEGMWLPETAVDTATLEVLAGQGIGFTILSPGQAARVRKITERAWTRVSRETLDCSRPYLCRLPSGRSIVIFFYEEGITNEVAFGTLLEDGKRFAERMMHYTARSGSDSGLLCIASDGETYGHHHRFGDMALAYALHLVRAGGMAEVTLPGSFLEAHPPGYEVEIVENSSWSCEHGIERWRSDCGCSTPGAITRESAGQAWGSIPGERGPGTARMRTWQQGWRGPLREAMDWVRETLAHVYEEKGRDFFIEPWNARDEYIGIVLDRSPDKVTAYLSRHGVRPLSCGEIVTALRLLEMQRHAMLMYTSCGWFFDDISGIEPIQVMRHACRAMQLAADVTGIDLEPGYLARLRDAVSNVPEYRDGATVYRKFVKPSAFDSCRLVFQSAVFSLVNGQPDTRSFPYHTIRYEEYVPCEAGRNKLLLGKAWLRSELTWEEGLVYFAVVQAGTDVMGGTSGHRDTLSPAPVQESIRSAFLAGDIPSLERAIEDLSGRRPYTIRDLTRDGQRRVMDTLLGQYLDEIKSVSREHRQALDRVLQGIKELQIPLPLHARGYVAYMLNQELQEMLAEGDPDLLRLRWLAGAFVDTGITPDRAMLQNTAETCFMHLMRRWHANPRDQAHPRLMNDMFWILAPLSLEMDLWECQNEYFVIGNTIGDEMRESAKNGDLDAREWLEQFRTLGEFLRVKVFDNVPDPAEQ